VYRERPDLQYAIPDPYDNSSVRATFYAWFETEGRVRFPALFSKEAPVPEDARADNPGISFFAGLRMATAVARPARRKRACASASCASSGARGLGGVARRLRGSHSG
jgi:hypothetical protein